MQHMMWRRRVCMTFHRGNHCDVIRPVKLGRSYGAFVSDRLRYWYPLLRTFAFPPPMMSVAVAVKMGLEAVAEVQMVLRGSLGVVGHEGGVEILGVLREALRVIGHKCRLEIQGMVGEGWMLRYVGRGEVQGVLWQSLRVVGDEPGLEVQRVFWQSLRVVRHERRGEVEGVLGERVRVIARDGRRGGDHQRQHDALRENGHLASLGAEVVMR